MRRGLFSGTFDPPSLGHLDLIYRAREICDELYIAIPIDPPHRKLSFTAKERKEMLLTITENIPNVFVHIYTGLPFRFAESQRTDFMIRGLRDPLEFDYEFRFALTNRLMVGIETIFLFTSDKYSHISTTLIREIARSGWRLRDFVPEKIEPFVYKRLSENSSIILQEQIESKNQN